MAANAIDATPAGRPTGRAFAWLALLAPLFFLSYGFATAVTARRDAAGGVGSVAFGWEHAIPFWPWTIVPYWTIDAFYGLSLLVCATRRELDTHARRLLTAQAICVGGFLLFPLRFSFERPLATGAFGWLFDVLAVFDKPYNQAPSLHIALLVILWVLYARHVPRRWQALLHGWAALIGLSVLTTWQHHFLDLPTGAAVGALCLWLWPDAGPSPLTRLRPTDDRRRRALALRYGLGGATFALLAGWLGGVALWLSWPALSLLLVTLAYAAIGIDAFQKRADGRLAFGAAALLAPCTLAAWINSRLWTRRAPQPVKVSDGIWLGRLPGAEDLKTFAACVDCCAELPVAVPATLDYHAVPMLDLVAPATTQLQRAADAIEACRNRGEPVLVCCALGYSRSAASVCAWLLRSGRAATLDVAVAMVGRARPAVVLGPEHLAALAAFERDRR